MISNSCRQSAVRGKKYELMLPIDRKVHHISKCILVCPRYDRVLCWPQKWSECLKKKQLTDHTENLEKMHIVPNITS